MFATFEASVGGGRIEVMARQVCYIKSNAIDENNSLIYFGNEKYVSVVGDVLTVRKTLEKALDYHG